MAYDKKAEYESVIAPIVKKLMTECDRIGVPVYFSCAVADDGKDTEYINDIVSSVAVDRNLSRDLFPKYALVYDGFNVVPYNDVSLIEEEIRAVAGEEGSSVTVTHGLKPRASSKAKEKGGINI